MNCPNCSLVNPPTAQRCDCGYDFVTKTVKEPYFREQIDSSLHGVGGWLLLFCAGVTIITPLVLLAQIAGNPQNGFVVIISLMLCAFSVYVGTSLWRIRPQALKLVKIYFIVTLGLALLALVGSIAGNQQKDLVRAIDGLIAVAIWWSYFKKSKRVKATLGRNL